MKRNGWIVSKYLLQNTLPYFLFSWLLLSVILFLQQASRYSEIFFSVYLPKSLVWQLTLALIPNVIAFTAPMAVLVGVIIGLSKMQGDSELVAMRSAGIGNLQIALPILGLGILLSGFAFFINLKGVPFAAQIVRKIALQSALYKLESPLEPGVFNTEVSGFTIYVKNVNFENGTWENIFIYNEEKSGRMRLITSKNGRIDSEGEDSELVLQNAGILTFDRTEVKQKLAFEDVSEFRLGIKTKKGELLQKIRSAEETPEELGLIELARYAKTRDGPERTEAQILWQRRILLSITPLIFSLLGTALVLRFNSRGKGFGIFLALVSLISYYLVTLLSEQLARTGQINVSLAGLIPIMISATAIAALFATHRKLIDRGKLRIKRQELKIISGRLTKTSRKNQYIDLTTGILDFDIALNLIKFFFLTIAFLGSIYLIFTAFELWKFAGTIDKGVFLLAQYLIYLIPFIYIQLSPSAAMIAVLATYIIKSRQNEIVTWTAAGQSVYRLLLPCFAVMLLIGGINWTIQETLLPDTNRVQDELRASIRSRGIKPSKKGKFWIADKERIYRFEIEENDSEHLRNLAIFDFSDEGSKLESVYFADKAAWKNNVLNFTDRAEKFTLAGESKESRDVTGSSLTVKHNPFFGVSDKPDHLSSDAIVQRISLTESEDERVGLQIALQKRYSTAILPLLVSLFTAPFAMSLSRKGKVLTVGYAVGIWLLFMGIGSFFEQIGANGYISPFLAVWSPLILFSVFGVYLLTKLRT